MGFDLRDMILKYGFNFFLNKMIIVFNLLVIYKYIKRIWMEVIYLDLLKSIGFEIIKLLFNFGIKLLVI